MFPVASMGPRSSEAEKAGNRRTNTWLQWGRARLSAEYAGTDERVPTWLQWGRARLSAETASMVSRVCLGTGFNGAALV